ncbi:CAP domain-containing protein [Anaerotruncus rubiinfantis]|uniref:CAP domain-containing protein n=1 Tax=Anaerotruncus rubiinfantis TaxID=1720200 RepID=UPI003D7B6C94
MKKRYIGIALAALGLGVLTLIRFGYPPMDAEVQPPTPDTILEQTVDEAVEKVMVQYEAEQKEKDAEIAALKEQLEELSSMVETDIQPQASSSQPEAPAPAAPAPSAQVSAPSVPDQPVQELADASPKKTSTPSYASESEGTVFTFEAFGDRAPEPVQESHPDETVDTPSDDFDYTLEEFADEVFYWTNVIREEHGLPAFEQDPILDEMAQVRATEGEHMTHTRPDGSTPDTIFHEYDTDLVCTGENLAGAGPSPKSVAYGFLETSHRENVLNPKATHLGIGCRWSETVIGDRIAVLQLFAK